MTSCNRCGAPLAIPRLNSQWPFEDAVRPAIHEPVKVPCACGYCLDIGAAVVTCGSERHEAKGGAKAGKEGWEPLPRKPAGKPWTRARLAPLPGEYPPPVPAKVPCACGYVNIPPTAGGFAESVTVVGGGGTKQDTHRISGCVQGEHGTVARKPWEIEVWAAPDPALNHGAVELHVGPEQGSCVQFGCADTDGGLDDWDQARLAAAAPELYRALAAAVEDYGKPPTWLVPMSGHFDVPAYDSLGTIITYHGEPPQMQTPPWLSAAQAALAKARGE